MSNVLNKRWACNCFLKVLLLSFPFLFSSFRFYTKEPLGTLIFCMAEMIMDCNTDCDSNAERSEWNGHSPWQYSGRSVPEAVLTLLPGSLRPWGLVLTVLLQTVKEVAGAAEAESIISVWSPCFFRPWCCGPRTFWGREWSFRRQVLCGFAKIQPKTPST